MQASSLPDVCHVPHSVLLEAPPVCLVCHACLPADKAALHQTPAQRGNGADEPQPPLQLCKPALERCTPHKACVALREHLLQLPLLLAPVEVVQPGQPAGCQAPPPAGHGQRGGRGTAPLLKLDALLLIQQMQGGRGCQADTTVRRRHGALDVKGGWRKR